MGTLGHHTQNPGGRRYPKMDKCTHLPYPFGDFPRLRRATWGAQVYPFVLAGFGWRRSTKTHHSTYLKRALAAGADMRRKIFGPWKSTVLTVQARVEIYTGPVVNSTDLPILREGLHSAHRRRRKIASLQLAWF